MVGKSLFPDRKDDCVDMSVISFLLLAPASLAILCCTGLTTGLSGIPPAASPGVARSQGRVLP